MNKQPNSLASYNNNQTPEEFVWGKGIERTMENRLYLTCCTDSVCRNMCIMIFRGKYGFDLFSLNK